MTNRTTNRTAEYKGKKYRLLFMGDTRHGRRAHLQFFSGDKDFWVDAKLVTDLGESSPSSRSSRASSGQTVCGECGRPGYLVRDLEDGMLKHRQCCDIEP